MTTATPTVSTSARHVGYDVVRAAALIAIVVGHVFTGPIARLAIFTWHVPIFFFLTGVLWRVDRGMRQEWAARRDSLLVPYLAWMLAIAVVSIPLAALSGAGPVVRMAGSMVLGGSYLKTPYAAFWFFTCLVWAALLLRAINPQTPRAWLVVGVIAAALTPLGRWLALLPLSVGTAVPALAFVAAGFGYNRAPPWLRGARAGSVLLALGVVLTAAGGNRPLDLKNGDFGTPFVGLVASTLICWGICALGTRVRWTRTTARISALVSACGSAFVLAHGLPLDLFYGSFDAWLVLLLVLAATAALVALASISPWRGVLLGMRPSAGVTVAPARAEVER